MNASMQTAASGDMVTSELRFRHEAAVLAIVCGAAWLGGVLSTDVSPALSASGMLLIYGLTVAGLLAARAASIRIPSVGWVSLVSIAATIHAPQWLQVRLEAVSFLSLVTPVLAYAAFAITTHDLASFRKSGIKLALVTLLVFAATFIGSAFVADLLL